MEQHNKKTIDSVNELDWGIKAIKADKVWCKTQGEGVKIAVIDSGLNNHKDLSHSFEGGMNMFNHTKDLTDDYAHGTFVAGLIAGKKTGVAPDSKVYGIKVLNEHGRGTMKSVLDGITYAINLKVDIICMSLGVSQSLPVIYQEKIMLAHDKGIHVVCATGNAGSFGLDYPAQLEETIAVGGIGKDMKLAKFSNRGKAVDISAPAVDILSVYKGDVYIKNTGTSMATGLVAGSIALILSHYRNIGREISPKELKKMIKELGSHSYSFGYGIMDLQSFIN